MVSSWPSSERSQNLHRITPSLRDPRCPGGEEGLRQDLRAIEKRPGEGGEQPWRRDFEPYWSSR